MISRRVYLQRFPFDYHLSLQQLWSWIFHQHHWLKIMEAQIHGYSAVCSVPEKSECTAVSNETMPRLFVGLTGFWHLQSIWGSAYILSALCCQKTARFYLTLDNVPVSLFTIVTWNSPISNWWPERRQINTASPGVLMWVGYVHVLWAL